MIGVCTHSKPMGSFVCDLTRGKEKLVIPRLSIPAPRQSRDRLHTYLTRRKPMIRLVAATEPPSRTAERFRFLDLVRVRWHADHHVRRITDPPASHVSVTRGVGNMTDMYVLHWLSPTKYECSWGSVPRERRVEAAKSGFAPLPPLSESLFPRDECNVLV